MQLANGVWLWALGLSAAMFLLSLAVLPIILIYLPADFFHRPSKSDQFAQRHPLVRLTYKVIKNALGVSLVFAGIIMLLTPGQGLLSILVGLLMIDFPGKHHFVRRILARPTVLRTINRIRAKAGRGPVEPPDSLLADPSRE